MLFSSYFRFNYYPVGIYLDAIVIVAVSIEY